MFFFLKTFFENKCGTHVVFNLESAGQQCVCILPRHDMHVCVPHTPFGPSVPHPLSSQPHLVCVHRVVLFRVCHGVGVCLPLLPAWPCAAIRAMGCIASGRWVPSLAPSFVSSKRAGGGRIHQQRWQVRHQCICHQSARLAQGRAVQEGHIHRGSQAAVLETMPARAASDTGSRCSNRVVGATRSDQTVGGHDCLWSDSCCDR